MSQEGLVTVFSDPNFSMSVLLLPPAQADGPDSVPSLGLVRDYAGYIAVFKVRWGPDG